MAQLARLCDWLEALSVKLLAVPVGADVLWHREPLKTLKSSVYGGVGIVCINSLGLMKVDPPVFTSEESLIYKKEKKNVEKKYEHISPPPFPGTLPKSISCALNHSDSHCVWTFAFLSGCVRTLFVRCSVYSCEWQMCWERGEGAAVN